MYDWMNVEAYLTVIITASLVTLYDVMLDVGCIMRRRRTHEELKKTGGKRQREENISSFF